MVCLIETSVDVRKEYYFGSCMYSCEGPQKPPIVTSESMLLRTYYAHFNASIIGSPLLGMVGLASFPGLRTAFIGTVTIRARSIGFTVAIDWFLSNNCKCNFFEAYKNLIVS